MFMENKSKLLSYLVGLLVVIAVGYVVHIGSSILIPLFLATFLAYLSDPLYVFLHEHLRIPRILTILIILLVLIAVIVGLQNILFVNVRDFYLSSDKYFQALTRETQDLLVYARKHNINIGLAEILNQIDVKGVLQFGINFVLRLASSMLFILLFTAFILLEREALSVKVEELSQRLGSRSGTKHVLRNINRQVRHYIVWKTVISLATGITSLIVFLLFDIDAPYLWAFIIFTFNYIPTIGSIIASIFPVVLTLVQFGSVGLMFFMALCMLVIQVTFGNVIEPRLMGSKLNLSPLVVLVSLLVWNKIWGVSGMFLAIPIMATLNIIMANIPALSNVSLLISNKTRRRFSRD